MKKIFLLAAAVSMLCMTSCFSGDNGDSYTSGTITTGSLESTESFRETTPITANIPERTISETAEDPVDELLELGYDEEINLLFDHSWFYSVKAVLHYHDIYMSGSAYSNLRDFINISYREEGLSPYDSFVVEYGAFPPVMVNAMNGYLAQNHTEITLRAKEIDKISDAYAKIDSGEPVIVWCCLNDAPYTASDGTEYPNFVTEILTKYDDSSVYLYSFVTSGTIEYNREDFEAVFASYPFAVALEDAAQPVDTLTE